MKKKNNIFISIITLLFIIFLGLFIASKSGFYEAKVNKASLLTSDAIERFEKDIEDGKPIDLEKYIENDNYDYSNAFTKAGEKIAKVTEEVFSGGIKDIWEFFKMLF